MHKRRSNAVDGPPVQFYLLYCHGRTWVFSPPCCRWSEKFVVLSLSAPFLFLHRRRWLPSLFKTKQNNKKN